MNKNNEKCMQIIKKLHLKPRIVTHEPVLNYEIANKVDQELGLTGTETKSLFLKGKSGNYYLFITFVIDPKIYAEEKLILAFGSETMSMEITKEELRKLLENTYDTIKYI